MTTPEATTNTPAGDTKDRADWLAFDPDAAAARITVGRRRDERIGKLEEQVGKLAKQVEQLIAASPRQ